jgi:hypothetical protein
MYLAFDAEPGGGHISLRLTEEESKAIDRLLVEIRRAHHR